MSAACDVTDSFFTDSVCQTQVVEHANCDHRTAGHCYICKYLLIAEGLNLNHMTMGIL